MGQHYPPTPDPTPAQIRQRCQEIQRMWTPEVERARRLASVTPPGGSIAWPRVETVLIRVSEVGDD